jgi:transposase
MSIVAETVEHVVGIDTHARTHAYCLVHARTGAVVDTATFPTSKAGNARAIDWIVRRCPGSLLVAIEGTSSYGAGISAALLERGFDVAEVRPAPRSTHAHAGKSDALDAEAAARSVIGRDYDTLARPRQTGPRAALRILLASRSIIDQQRTANRNALTALLRTVDLGVDARKPLTDPQIRSIAAWRTSRTTSSEALVIARREGRRLALAVLEQTESLKTNHRELRQLTEQLAPASRTFPGSDRSPPRSSSAPTPTAGASAPNRHSQPSVASHRYRRPRATPPGTDCPDQETDSSTAHSTSPSAVA